MADARNTRAELVRLAQLMVMDGARISASFAAKHGLHQTDVDALIRVMIAEERGTPMTAGTLVGELGLTSGAITFVVDRLERAGHVARVRDSIDRRKVLLHHSPSGRAVAEEFFAPTGRHTDDAMDQFTADELEIARRYLEVTTTGMAEYRRSLSAADRPV